MPLPLVATSVMVAGVSSAVVAGQVAGDWWRGDCDTDRGDVRVLNAIVHLEGEGIGASVPGGWCVSYLVIALNRAECAVCRADDDAVRQGAIFRIAASKGDRGWRILRCRLAAAGRGRSPVHRQRHRGGVRGWLHCRWPRT